MEKNGILQIKDIIYTNGTILSLEDLYDRYKIKTDFLTLYSLVHAIPKKWRNYLTHETTINVPTNTDSTAEIIIRINGQIYPINNLTSKIIYWILIDRIKKPPAAIDKWMSEFPFLNDRDFQDIYRLPYAITPCTKTQTFQYKLINLLTPGNQNLQKWGIKESAICHYCSEIETIEHMFYSCKYSKMFWTSIQNWIQYNLDIKIPLSITDVLFGIPRNTDEVILYTNLIILYGKKYILTSRIAETDIFVLSFLHEITSITKLLYQGEALKLNNTENRWRNLHDLLCIEN